MKYTEQKQYKEIKYKDHYYLCEVKDNKVLGDTCILQDTLVLPNILSANFLHLSSLIGLILFIVILVSIVKGKSDELTK